MRKFKLIKEYPGSPKLDTVVVSTTDNNAQFIQGRWIYRIECSPLYWQEVVEKDYEILSFKSPAGIMEVNSNEVLSYVGNGDKIHSVKRLVDGEIFTVGDKTSNVYGTDITNINKFEFNHNTITINNNYARISEINKVKQPLFKTEDLKEVFDQQRFYTVALENEFDDYFEIFEQSLYSASNSDVEEFLKSKDKHFSTRKAAKEYVLMNNPCLSIQDVLNKLDFEQEDRFITMELLKDLVKSKNK